MRACLLLVPLLASGCLDVVLHGFPVELTVSNGNCEGVDAAAGALELRITARSADTVLFSRTEPIGSGVRTVGMAEGSDVQLSVEALDADGQVIARGSSAHFTVSRSPPAKALVELFAVGQFTRVCNALVTARAFHTATLLPDGRVLIIGGQGPNGEALSSMEMLSGSDVRDVGPLALRTAGSTFRFPRARHAAIPGSRSQVLVSGGEQAGAPSSTNLIVDPEFGFGTGALGQRNSPRSRHAAFKVGGNVFLVGGITFEQGSAVPNPMIERVDLNANTVETSFTLAVPRLESALALLGSVAIVAGGLEGTAPSARVELVPLDASSVATELTLSTARTLATAIQIGDRVLLAGGNGADGAPLGSTEWIGRGTEPGPSIIPRAAPCSVRVSARALLLGGLASNGPSAAAELIDSDGVKTTLRFPGEARHGHSCVVLEDGSVLVSGGLGAAGNPLGDLWRYMPRE